MKQSDGTWPIVGLHVRTLLNTTRRMAAWTGRVGSLPDLEADCPAKAGLLPAAFGRYCPKENYRCGFGICAATHLHLIVPSIRPKVWICHILGRLTYMVNAQSLVVALLFDNTPIVISACFGEMGGNFAYSNIQITRVFAQAEIKHQSRDQLPRMVYFSKYRRGWKWGSLVLGGSLAAAACRRLYLDNMEPFSCASFV